MILLILIVVAAVVKAVCSMCLSKWVWKECV